MRVHGYVAPGSIERDVEQRRVRFAVVNDPPHAGGVPSDTLPVLYATLETPDMFKDGAEVVVEGRLADERRLRRGQRAREVPVQVRGPGDPARVVLERASFRTLWPTGAPGGRNTRLPEIGLYALRLAFFVALAGACAGVMGGLRERNDWAEVARRAVGVTFVLTLIGMGMLLHALIDLRLPARLRRPALGAQHDAALPRRRRCGVARADRCCSGS